MKTLARTIARAYFSGARLLKERPNAIGLAVPGMPQGSPMEASVHDPYEVLLVRHDGTSTSYQKYGK